MPNLANSHTNMNFLLSIKNDFKKAKGYFEIYGKNLIEFIFINPCIFSSDV